MAKDSRTPRTLDYVPAPAGRKNGAPTEADIFRAEREYIGARRAAAGLRGRERNRKGVAALAISGGGIRSATFSLGILQALAAQDLLRHFDYLSTVSGGGYLGSSLVWWLSGKANGKQPGPRFGLGRDFPYGTRPPHPQAGAKDTDRDEQRAVLRYVRQRGEYLTPGGGITLASGIAAVLRGILLNVPLLLFFLVAALAALEWAAERWLGGVAWINRLFVAVMAWLAEWIDQLLSVKQVTGAAGGVPLPPAAPVPLPPTPLLYQALVALAILLLALFAAFALAYATYSLISRGTGEYSLRRGSEVWAGRCLAGAAILFLLGIVPFVSHLLGDVTALVLSAAVGIAPIAVGAAKFLAPGSGQGSFLTGDRIVKTVSALLLALLALWAYSLVRRWFPVPGAPGAPYGGLALLTALALLFSLLVNVNHVSLHRFYRDRLMEAFLPDWATVNEDRSRAVRFSDRAWLPAFAAAGRVAGTPYHLINVNAVLVDSDNLTWRERGGDNFILSPLYCGSAATGWRSSPSFMRGEMSLATAMATSGAAANPNAVGVTRSRLVSLLMSILNLRLGLWVPNPRYWTLQWAWPNHILPGLSQVLSGGALGFREGSAFVQLSDGGHFENLALYEPIRRRAGLIVLCDGAADAAFQFEDFQQCARRIATDFGATIDFEPGHGFVRLDRTAEMAPPNVLAVTRDGKRRTVSWPRHLKVAHAPYVVGAIRYADGEAGALIYVKATLIEGLPPEVLGYAAANPEFPHQTTADQFFDEEQFEAYRQLGYRQGSAIERELKARLARLA